MDFNVSEDDIRIDFMCLIGKPPSNTVTTMRDDCQDKSTYQEPPPPPISPSSSMLNDEAPDNLLSSAALEKNIFSDDDEYGLYRLKRSEKNVAKSNWEMDFTTDDLIKKESDLGLDIDNLPPTSLPPSQMKKDTGKVLQSNEVKDDASHNVASPADVDTEEEHELIFEVVTEENVLREDENGDLCDIESIPTNFGCHSQSSFNDADNEGDENISLALDDHNYTSPKLKFDAVAQYINTMNPNQDSYILDLLESKKRNNGRWLGRQNVDNKEFEPDDYDAVSNASTELFVADDRKNDAEVNGGEESDDEETSHRQAHSLKTMCKEELVIDEGHPDADGGSNLSEDENDTDEQNSEDKPKNVGVWMKTEKSVETEIAETVGSAPISPLSDFNGFADPVLRCQESNTACAGGKTASTESTCYSENRSEPNEFFDTEDVSTSGSENEEARPEKSDDGQISLELPVEPSSKTIKMEDCKQADSAMEVETTADEKDENKATETISLHADQQTESTDQNRETSPALESNPTVAHEPENPKLLELKIFANRLLGLCESWENDSNLDEQMNVLLADFREIIGKPKVVSSETQTEKIYSKERRKKMNEKAKNKLLNASSSSSEDMSNSDDDDDDDNDEEIDIESNKSTQEPTGLPDNGEEEIAGDDEKFEKSPSYSDLSSRASSEEFLNSENDENDDLISDDGIDLSKYVVPSPNKSASQETEDLDLSKYEVHSGEPAESHKVSVTSEQMSSDENKVAESVPQDKTAEEDIEKTTSDENPFNDSSGNPMIGIGCDEDVNYDNNEVVENEVIENDGDAVEIVCEVDMQIDDMEEEKESMEEIIARDEKLKSEAMVVVNKLSEEDLEEYYDDLNEKEIRKLLNFSGLVKKKSSDAPQYASERPQVPVRSKKTKKLMEILKDVENDICSDESNSDDEEAPVTERDFLKLCNQKAKEDFLKSSSSDSEADTKVSDDEIIDQISMSDYSSSDDENRPTMVDKFLEKFSCKLHDEVKNLETDTMNPEEECVIEQAKNQNDAIKELVGKETDNQMDNHPTSVPSEAMDINDFGEEISGDELSDDVVVINDASKNDKEADKEKEIEAPSTAPKPSSTHGILRTIRNILVEKEIDIDAIEKEPASLSNDEADNFDRQLSRKLSNSKSLETLIEESQRRQNAKSTDNNIVSLDSDSDCEEISVEPDVRKRSIKPMLRKDQLAGETRTAQRRENERIKRLERKNEMLAKLIQEHKDELDLVVEEKELILDYHTENKTFIKVHAEIVKHLKEHQFEGIKFMYDNTYGSVDHLPKHPGSGCILAHCMGLGKTLQIVALLHTVINYKELDTRKILVLCPKSTIMNWDDEIRRWLGPLKSNTLKIFSFKDTSSSIEDKIKILHEWSSSGKPGFRSAGCLLLGYEAFRMLVFNPLHKKKIVSQLQTERIKKKIRETLLEPGADLVICDEGHIIKNRKSATSSAVSEISTPRRIILTGTPIQNNLKEYYAMVNFIKPKFLGTEKEFANLYENPIRNGQHKDSNKRDIKIMKQRSFVLHKKLSKFVQRREAALLKTFLPMKFEYVLFIPMTDVQIKLYEHFLEVSSKREGSKGKTLIPDYTCLRKIWTHPRVLENAWKNAMLKKQNAKKSPVREPNSDDEVPDDVYDTQTGALSVTDDWWRSLTIEDNLKSILPSSKLQVMFDILRMCEEMREKCLIFSAFVAVLDCVEFFMHQITVQGENAREYGLSMFRGPWVSGKDYYRLDGKTPKNIRHEMIKRFNDPTMTQARVFLISAKAGGQGINLIGANRVIILDTSWNPSNDQQNIFRVFRLGQKRQCYVYRLIAMGTMEEKVYSRSVTKQAMSFRVVDEQQIDRHYSMAELTELYTLTKPDYQNRPVPPLPQDSILANLLRCSPHLVYKYHEHDSLLENKLEQELSEQEKADAWDAYERDLQGNQNPNLMPGMSNVPSLSNFPPFFGPGMGYGFHTDRNYPLGYGGLSPGYLSSLAGYTGNSSLMEMLKMYSAPPPPGGPPLMPGMNPGPSSSPQGNLMHPFGAGILPTNPGTSSSLALNLPSFNSLQSMVSSTGISSIPSYTSPYSSMANSYNLSNDPALLHLSQMYAPSLPSSMAPADSRSPTGRQPNSSPSAGGVADKRNSPFPSGLMAPMSTAESIPTSVIKPPQAHSASTQRQSTSTPTLAQQLSNHSMPGPSFSKPPLSNAVASSLQQQLAKSRAPNLDYRSQVIQSLYQHAMSGPRSGDTPYSQGSVVSPKSSAIYSSNTTIASTLPSVITTLATTGLNRNSPITTSSRNSPQPKSSSSLNNSRATNIGIVYPYDNNSATITPISSAPSTATSMSGISVRSVSSINNASSSKLTIPATIISKPGANVPTALPSIYKQNNSNSTNNIMGGNSALTMSPVGKQYNGPSISKTSSLVDKSQPSPATPGGSLPPQFRHQAPPQQSQNKQVNSVDKSTIQILGTNNVQLTKVPNSRSTISKPQNNAAKLQTYSRNRIASSQSSSAATPSVITKARANSGLTVVPVPNNSPTTNGKVMQNESPNTVPTLVPLSTKTNINPSGRSMPAVANKNAKTSSSMVTTTVMPNVPAHIKQMRPTGTKSPAPILKKPINNAANRVAGPAPKLSRIQPTTPSPTTVGASVKRSVSLVNLPVNKHARSSLSNSTQPRQTSLLLNNAQNSVTRPQMTVPGKLATSASATNLASASSSPATANKNTLSIRSIDAINKFANAGITISPGRTKGGPSSQNPLGNVMNQTNSMKNMNSLSSGNQSTLSNSVTLSKVIPASRKRPVGNLTPKPLPSINQMKKPRLGPTVEERNVAESLLRARSNQGLTVLLKNSQGQQKSNKDVPTELALFTYGAILNKLRGGGSRKVADVVEID